MPVITEKRHAIMSVGNFAAGLGTDPLIRLEAIRDVTGLYVMKPINLGLLLA
jgi:hypothetical protein